MTHTSAASRSGRRRPSKTARDALLRRAIPIEFLEPRVLLSNTYVNLTGTAAADTFTISLDSTGTTVSIYRDVPTNGTPTLSLPRSDLGGISMNGNGGADTFVIDETNGDPIAGVPVSLFDYDGNSPNTLAVIDPHNPRLSYPDGINQYTGEPDAVAVTDDNGVNDTINVAGIDDFSVAAADDSNTLAIQYGDSTPVVDWDGGAAVLASSDGNGGMLVSDTQGVSMDFDCDGYPEIGFDVGSAGAVTFDLSDGSPLPGGTLNVNAGRITLTDSGGSPAGGGLSGQGLTLNTTTGSAVFSSANVAATTLNFPTTSPITLDRADATDSVLVDSGYVYLSAGTATAGPAVNVAAGATVFFDGTQTVSDLTVHSGGLARELQDGSSVLVVGSLDLEPATDQMPGGILDVADNDLIVQSDDANNGNGSNDTLDQVNGWLATGYDSGKLDGWFGNGPTPACIVSIVSDKLTVPYTAIGILSVSDTGLLQPGLFDGVAVTDGDVVCRYTYAGDANLDGTVNSTDDSLIENDITQYNSDATDDPGWAQGNLTYTEYSPPVGQQDDTLVQQTESLDPLTLAPATENQPYTLNLPAFAAAEDVQNYFPGSVDYTEWMIDWGDGSPVQSCPIDPTTGQFDPVTHTFAAAAGMYDVSLRAFGTTGGQWVSVVHPHQDLVVTPDAPTGLTADTSTPGVVNLTWTDDTQVATGYVITATDPSGVVTTYNTPAGTLTCAATGLTAGVNYTFTVTAADSIADGQSVSSTSVSTTATVPALSAPTTFSETVISPTEIDLAWTAPADPGDATGYDLEQYISGSWQPLDSVSLTQTSYQVTDLNPSTAYSFGVATGDGAGDSAYDTASASTPTPPVVNASAPATVAEGGTVSLALNSSSAAAGSDVVAGWSVDWGFTILDSSGNVVENIQTYTGTNMTVSEAMPASYTGLQITATAITAAGSAVPSYQVQADPVYVDTVPIAPTNVTATADNAQDVTVTFQSTAQAADQYIVLRNSGDGNGFVPIDTLFASDLTPDASGNFTYDDPSVSPSTSYQYEVQAVGGLDDTVRSTSAASSSVTTPSDALNFTLIATVADAIASSAVLNWTYAGNDATGFEIESADLSAGENYAALVQTTQNDNCYTMASLHTGDLYGVRMRVDFTDGTVSDWVTQTVTPTPTLIPGVTATPYTDSSGTNNFIDVAWTYPSTITGSPDVLIQYRGTGTDGSFWYDAPNTDEGICTGSAGHALIDIDDGESAQFRVEMPGVANGGWGVSQTVTQAGTAGPAGYFTLTDNGDGTATAAWGGAGTSASYSLAVFDSTDTDEVFDTNTAVPAGSQVLDDLTPGGVYYCIATTYTPTGATGEEGFTKETFDMTGSAPPNAPTNLKISLTGPTTASLIWTDNSHDEAGFKVYRSDDPSFPTSSTGQVASLSPDQTSYTATLPDATTIWYYRVYAVNAAGDKSTAWAQNSVGGIILTQLSFGGERHTPTDNNHPEIDIQKIARDNSSSGITYYGSPQWLDLNGNGHIDAGNTPVYQDGTVNGPAGQDHEYPVSYMRSLPDSPAYIDITLTLHATVAVPEFYLEGVGGGFTFTAWTTLRAGDNTIYCWSTDKIPTTIASIDLAIKWQMSFDDRKTYSTIVTTDNHLYVTGGRADGAFQTMLYIGCGAANGTSPHEYNQLDPAASNQDQSVINPIWAKFQTLNVTRVDGTRLTYYKNYRTNATTAGGLLSGSDGQCGSWASLLFDILYYEGVAGINYTTFTAGGAIPSPMGQNQHGFIVKNWTFNGNGTLRGQAFPYVNIPGPGLINAAGNGYVWMSADVTQAAGIAGQGNPDPASFFSNHQVVKISNALGMVYLDPSYGQFYTSTANFQAKALCGFWYTSGLLVNGAATVGYLLEKTPAANQVQASDWLNAAPIAARP